MAEKSLLAAWLCVSGLASAASPAIAQQTAASAPAPKVYTAARPQSAASAPAAALEDYVVLAQSPSEGVVVLRGPDQRLVTVRVGSVLAPAHARLVQIQGGRLKFDTVDAKGSRQIAWMTPGAAPDRPSEVQRISFDGPPPRTAAALVPLNVPPPSTSKSSK